MAASENGKQYVLGKGRLYFNQFLAGANIGTGERYLGNSPTLTVSVSSDTLDHIDADQGLNVKDESIKISDDMTLSIDLDSISAENVAMWYGGEIERTAVAAATAVVEPDFTANRGRWVQLGTNEDMPAGTRMVTNVTISTVTPGTLPEDPDVVTALTPTQMEANTEIDLNLARIYIEPDAAQIPDGATLRVTYDQVAIQPVTIIGRGDEIRGELRFIADNPKGDNKDQFWPYVKLTANGDYALKGDDWQTMSFSGEVLKLNDTTERVYITSRPAATVTP